MAILFYLSYESYISWINAFKCSEIPEYEKFLASFSFDPFLIFNAPEKFFEYVFTSISRFNEYLDHLTFKKNYIWDFLPPNKNFSIFNIGLNYLIKSLVILIYTSIPFLSVYFIFRGKDQKIFNLLLLILFICLNLWAIFNLTKNIYDASFFYTTLVIILSFLIAQNLIFSNNFIRVKKFIFFYILSISLLSQFILISTNLIPFIKGYTGPGIRIGHYELNNVHESIKNAANICKIDETNGKNIVVDDLTYGFFRKTHGPISYSYNGVGVTKTPLHDLFNTVSSDGMILDCNVFPVKYRDQSSKSNNICCFSKDSIKKFFIDKNSELDK